jgi:hypothetical protein
MRPRYDQFNPKRRLKKPDPGDREALALLAEKIGYGGNPEHKKNPGDFGLIPPSDPRRGKSLCDVAGVFTRRLAHSLLQQGLRKGLVSDRFEGEWPKNIWSVTDSGIPLEAQLENPVLGTYHGYPMPTSDPLAAEVLRLWNATPHV